MPHKTVVVILCSFALATHIKADSITATAFCSDASTTRTESTASCVGDLANASSTAGSTSVLAQAAYIGGAMPLDFLARASASFDADYLLTIHGGSGLGSFTACLRAEGFDNGNSSATGSGFASFGPFAIAASGNRSESTCMTAGSYEIPFDVPTVFHLHLSAFASGDSTLPRSAGGLGAASFDGIVVFSNDTNSPPGALSYTLTELPEPSTAFAAGLGLTALLLVRAK